MVQAKQRFSRRKFVAAVGLGGLGLVGYTKWIEPGWLQIGRHTIPIEKFPPQSPLKLLHLSDLHASRVVSLEFIRRAIALGLRENPDLICLTGDFVTGRFAALDDYVRVLNPLAEHGPTFACLGNHDGGQWARAKHGYASTNEVRDLLRKSGVTLLHNASQTLSIGGRELVLVGLGDPWAGELQPTIAFSKVSATQPLLVVLSHNPDSKLDLKPFAWDLLLCGHTHGGQLRLPIIGAPFAPIRDRRYVEGLHRWEGRWLHITRGVGNLYGVRFNCPPEISLLTLT